MWTLEKIRERIRYILGLSREQLSDENLSMAIQEYWSCSLPFELREELFYKEEFQLITQPGRDLYPIKKKWRVLQPTAFCDGRPISLYYDRSLFEKLRPHYGPKVQVGVGDGSESIFSYTFSGSITPSATLAWYNDSFDNQILVNVFDKDNGVLDVIENTATVSFNQPVPVDAAVYMTTVPGLSSAPCNVLVGSDVICIWPVPYLQHVITVNGMNVVDVNQEGELPIRPELGNVVVYGTVVELLNQRNDLAAAQNFKQVYDEYLRVAIGKRVVEVSSSRVLPSDL